MSLSVKRKDCKRQTYWPILSSLETVLTFRFILFSSELHSKHCYKEFINCSYTILCTHICACFYAVLINEGHYLCFCLPLCVPMFELNISSSPPPSPESLPLPLGLLRLCCIIWTWVLMRCSSSRSLASLRAHTTDNTTNEHTRHWLHTSSRGINGTQVS